jgi:hypothetical protein
LISVGIAVDKITPPVGCDLTGYVGRPGPALSVHDDLYAKALILDDGQTRVGILTLDLLGLTSDQARRIRALAESDAGLAPGNLLIVCSHTHAGPAVQFLRRCGTPDPEYIDWMIEKAAEVVAQASERLSPEQVYFTRAQSDLGKYRRGYLRRLGEGRDEPFDHEVGAILIGSKPAWKAVIYNYGCHGVVLGLLNREISADWIGTASRAIESATGATAFFLQGCCGDINPRQQGGFDIVEQLGGSLGSNVVAALDDSVPVDGPLAIASEMVDLPVLPPMSVEDLEKIAAEESGLADDARATGRVDKDIEVSAHLAMKMWAEELIDHIRRGDIKPSVTVEVQAIRIGDVRIAALPGEAFTDIGKRLKVEGDKTIVAGYANGNIGYIPTAEAYSEGGYEVDGAFRYYGLQMIGPESEEIVTQAALRLLRRL